ncbi:MAG: hypothetical protein PGN09_01690 [Sphingomonas fennica]
MVGPGDIAFRRRHAHVLAEAQGALNISFGAILSAYIGIGLADVDNHPFDHHVMARFFLLLAAFVMSLCVGNTLLLRGELRPAAILLAVAVVAALAAHHEGRVLGFEVTILRIVSGCWFVALLASDALLTLFLHLHRKAK